VGWRRRRAWTSPWRRLLLTVCSVSTRTSSHPRRGVLALSTPTTILTATMLLGRHRRTTSTRPSRYVPSASPSFAPSSAPSAAPSQSPSAGLTQAPTASPSQVYPGGQRAPLPPPPPPSSPPRSRNENSRPGDGEWVPLEEVLRCAEQLQWEAEAARREAAEGREQLERLQRELRLAYGDEKTLKPLSEPELHELCQVLCEMPSERIEHTTTPMLRRHSGLVVGWLQVLEASVAAARDALMRKQLEHVRDVEARRAAEASAAEVRPTPQTYWVFLGGCVAFVWPPSGQRSSVCCGLLRSRKPLCAVGLPTPMPSRSTHLIVGGLRRRRPFADFRGARRSGAGQAAGGGAGGADGGRGQPVPRVRGALQEHGVPVRPYGLLLLRHQPGFAQPLPDLPRARCATHHALLSELEWMR